MITRTHSDELGTRVAWFSDCERYRYLLRIPVMSPSRPPRRMVAFLMCNPSTATEAKNDPTVAKCCKYARAWGYDDVVIINIFAWRSTDPEVLPNVDDPVGPDNDRIISDETTAAEIVVCAWSQHGKLLARGAKVRRLLADSGKLHYLRLSAHPWHPLYLPDATKPTRWE